MRAQVDSAPILNTAYDVYFRFSYTYQPVSEFRGARFSNIPSFGSVSVSGNRLPYAPEQMAVASVGYVYSAFDARLEAVHTGEQFTDDLNTVAPTADGQRGLIDASVVWNAAVNYVVGRSTLFFTVKNLLDELYIVDRSRGILPSSPRLVHAGVRVGF
jgi:Fe(3+) dicitrate transport protein